MKSTLIVYCPGEWQKISASVTIKGQQTMRELIERLRLVGVEIGTAETESLRQAFAPPEPPTLRAYPAPAPMPNAPGWYQKFNRRNCK